jgi:hypothetical protein
VTSHTMTSCTLDALLLLGKIAEKNLSELPHGQDTPMHYTRGPSTRYSALVFFKQSKSVRVGDLGTGIFFQVWA